jgi:REP element-mobilizing transposase RayT
MIIIIYHIVCPVKYRRAVITSEADKKIKEICLETEKRYEIKFLEIGTEKDHVHFLVQSVSAQSGGYNTKDKKHNGGENIRGMP